MVTPFGRFVLWCLTLFLGLVWLNTLVQAPGSALFCAPFIFLLWGYTSKLIIFLFETDEVTFQVPRTESGPGAGNSTGPGADSRGEGRGLP